MAKDDDGVQLFGKCNICVVCLKDLDLGTANELAVAAKEHGAEVVVVQPPAAFPKIQEFSHIISTTVDFPAYQNACDALIPVVKPQWLHTSISNKKLANLRQYNPDPRLFLNDVVVSCGDIPEGDKDAIIGGVLAMGGIYSPRINQQVTHLVDLTTGSDKAKLVLDKKLSTKIVLPHWFDDCLKLGKRIDERPYTLPNPEILRVGPTAPIRSAGNKDIIGASTLEPSQLPSPAVSPQRRRNLSIFEGKQIKLSSDLGIGSRLLASIEELIQQGRGSITSDLHKADMFICRYREGDEYQMASRLNKDVGNLSWLYHLITHDSWTSPLRRLLHYPISRTGIPGFKGFKISLSNYAGEARSYLENLIAAAGAECTKTLTQDNTHLVTAHGNSEKCTAAKEWGLYVVNHLWLEESYAKWKLQPVSDPRYTHFPKRTNLSEIVGQTKLDRSVLESNFITPASQNPPKPKLTFDNRPMKEPKPKPIKQTQIVPIFNDPQNAGTPRRGIEGKLVTPVVSRFVAEGKENDIDTPSTTSSRKSKVVAAQRLHEIAPDIALYEKEMKRVGGLIYGGRRKDDEDLITNTKKRKSTEAQPDESETDERDEIKKLKKPKLPPITIHLLITGFERWVGNLKKEDTDKRQLRELGISVVQEARKCSHLAAPSILRTPKFVNALAYSPVIVNLDFVIQCLEKNELLDPSDYLLMDEATEKKIGFRLAEARNRAQVNKNKLLRGYHVCCLESIRGGFDAFKSIVETNGGECTLFRGKVSMGDPHIPADDHDSGGAEGKSNGEDLYLLSGILPDQVKLWHRFRRMATDVGKRPRIVQVNWLLDIAMSQEIRWKDEYELSEDMVGE